MMNSRFIWLTTPSGTKFLVNIDQIKMIYPLDDGGWECKGKCYIIYLSHRDINYVIREEEFNKVLKPEIESDIVGDEDD